MGNLLIFVILAVTIPRWAMTLAQVDTFGFAIGGHMIAIAAIGEAIVLEFGNLYVLRTFTRCQRQAFEYAAWWETHDQLMKDQGKTNRKPENNPKIRGYQILPLALLILEVLTLLAQTPFIAGQLLGRPAVDLLNQWGTGWVWGYAFLLVISPGVMTVAIGFAINYADVIKEIGAKKEKVEIVPWHEHLRTWVFDLIREWRAARAVSGQVSGQPAIVSGVPDEMPGQDWALETEPGTDRASDRASDQALAGQPDTSETSQALAGHLAELQERLAGQRQQGQRSNGTFRRAEVESVLGLSNSHSKNVIGYGLEHGILERAGQYKYRFTPK